MQLKGEGEMEKGKIFGQLLLLVFSLLTSVVLRFCCILMIGHINTCSFQNVNINNIKYHRINREPKDFFFW